MEYIIESSLDSYFSMGIEEWVFNFLELLEMTEIFSSSSVRVKSKVMEMGNSFSGAHGGDDENLLFSICEGKKQGY